MPDYVFSDLKDRSSPSPYADIKVKQRANHVRRISTGTERMIDEEISRMAEDESLTGDLVLAHKKSRSLQSTAVVTPTPPAHQTESASGRESKKSP